MTHIGTQTIKTKRLTLRPFCIEDVQAVFNNWASDSEVTKFLRWTAHTDISTTKRVLESWVSDYSRKNFYQWAIVPSDLGEPIGCIGVVEQDDRISMVHIGYALGKKWWNKGYMSEALEAVIEFFFTQVGVNRIESQHDPNNIGSGRVMQKCGMIFEGTKRQADFSNKGIVDACMYAILKEDWRCQ